MVVVQLIPGLMWADSSYTMTRNRLNKCIFQLPDHLFGVKVQSINLNMFRGLGRILWSHHLLSAECQAVLNEEYIFLIIPVSLIQPRFRSRCC